MIQISISDEIAWVCPGLEILSIACDIENTPSDPELWEEITKEEELFRSNYRIKDINKRIPIQATRQAYKKLGKDPNRYRPSSEALCRRILRGLPLYKIDTLVDLVNLISIRTGYSIGAFDAEKIEGEKLVLGIGRERELYNGIGRGELHIQGLPVYRDKKGGIGTPTSDEERTRVELSTRRLLMIINGYSGNEGLDAAEEMAISLLQRYVKGKNFAIGRIIKK
ncbi:MAG: hypothetical protein LUE98_19245 [Tannerellaceae bacterium]|nr:hypothetical protein [Tannerellaceae bacterium]